MPTEISIAELPDAMSARLRDECRELDPRSWSSVDDFMRDLVADCESDQVPVHDGIPDILANVEEPRPMAADDPRLDAALATATVRRLKAGAFIAETPDMDAEGKTKAAALANLREELRYVISDPVKVKYCAYGKSFVAEARPGRDGGFWAVVPSLGGASTCGDTMDDLKYMLIDMTKLMIENT